MKKITAIFIVIILTLSVISVSACTVEIPETPEASKTSKTSEVPETPETTTATGDINQTVSPTDPTSPKPADPEDPQVSVIYFDGKTVIDEEDIGDRLILNWFFDVECSACAELEFILENEYETILGDRYVIKFRPTAMMGDGGRYSFSAVGAGYLLSMAENEPDNFASFLAIVMDPTIIQDTSEESFKEVYDGDNWDAIEASLEDKIDEVLTITDYMRYSDYISELSYLDGSKYVPFIFREGDHQTVDFSEILDVVQFFTDYLAG